MSLPRNHETVYRHVRPNASVFCEDFAIVVTIEGSGSIAGQTFEVDMFDPDGVTVAGPSVSITDAVNRQVTAVFSGLTLVVGLHKVVIFRTNTNFRTETARYDINVVNAKE